MLDTMMENWYDSIDAKKGFFTPSLDIRSVRRCVLGQLFGNFYYGKKELALTTEEVKFFGLFSIDQKELTYLNFFWRREVLKRQKRG